MQKSQNLLYAKNICYMNGIMNFLKTITYGFIKTSRDTDNKIFEVLT